jgi:hypothetical protein
MIHCLLTWTLLILAPEAVEGQFLTSVLVGMVVGRCGRPTSRSWDEPPSLADAHDALGMTVVAVDRPERWTHVTTPSEIISYYHLNHSFWSLSNNKELSH